MALKKAEVKYLIGALISGLCCTGFLVASLATNFWLTASPKQTTGNQSDSLNYGLFFGSYDRTSINTETFPLTITCLMDENVCAWSCKDTEEARTEEVKKLFETGTATFACSQTVTYGYEQGTDSKAAAKDSSNFLTAGMWVSTLFFLCLSLLFSIIACGFTALNIFSNPIDTYAGILGLYVWLGVTFFSNLLVLILWGAEFSTHLSTNVAILDTINGQWTSDGLAELGFSYYILLVAEVELCSAAGLIYYRQRKLSKPEEQNVIKIEDTANDAHGFLY